MTKTRVLVLGLGGVLLLGGAAFMTVYLLFFNPKPVATVSLPPRSAATPTGALAGRWNIAEGSFVGYRVREQLAQLPAPTDAVGRTSAVTGSVGVTMNSDGSATVSDINVKADLSQLTSDSRRRDNFVRNNALDTYTHPEASFAGTQPVTVPAPIVAGAAGEVTVPGTFTIHGQDRAVSLVLKVQRNGASVNVVASYTFQWGDYGVERPSVPVASVQSNPTIEISLVLNSG